MSRMPMPLPEKNGEGPDLLARETTLSDRSTKPVLCYIRRLVFLAEQSVLTSQTISKTR